MVFNSELNKITVEQDPEVFIKDPVSSEVKDPNLDTITADRVQSFLNDWFNNHIEWDSVSYNLIANAENDEIVLSIVPSQDYESLLSNGDIDDTLASSMGSVRMDLDVDLITNYFDSLPFQEYYIKLENIKIEKPFVEVYSRIRDALLNLSGFEVRYGNLEVEDVREGRYIYELELNEELSDEIMASFGRALVGREPISLEKLYSLRDDIESRSRVEHHTLVSTLLKRAEEKVLENTLSNMSVG